MRLVDYIVSDMLVRNNMIDKTKVGMILAFFRLYVKYSTFRYTVWMRIKQFSRPNSLLGWVSKVVVHIKSNRLHIYCGTRNIGRGLHIVHEGNIRINAESIGDYFTVYHGVTIGAGKEGLPTIGNQVTCYTNCVVVGGVNVGDCVRIGATTFVNYDVPQGSTVINKCIVKGEKL